MNKYSFSKPSQNDSILGKQREEKSNLQHSYKKHHRDKKVRFCYESVHGQNYTRCNQSFSVPFSFLNQFTDFFFFFLNEPCSRKRPHAVCSRGKKVQNDINLVETTAQNDKPIFRVILMIKQRMNHIKQRVSCSSAAPALLCELV